MDGMFRDMIMYIYIYIPGTQMTSILDGQPLNKKAFSNQKKVIWVPGIKIFHTNYTGSSESACLWTHQSGDSNHCKDYHRAGISMNEYIPASSKEG